MDSHSPRQTWENGGKMGGKHLVEVVRKLLLPGQVAAGNPVAVRLGRKLGAQLLPARK